jgi:DNA polymerase-1
MHTNYFCFDVETTGLQFGVDKIISVSIAENGNVYFLHPLGNETLESFHVRAKTQLSILLENYVDTDTVIFNHNIKFDLRMAEIPPNLVDRLNVEDTTYLYHYLEPRKEKALSEIETDLFGTDVKKQFVDRYGKKFDLWPKDELEQYNKHDVELTVKLYHMLWGRVPTNFNSYMRRLLKAIYRIEYYGFPFDSEKASEVNRDFTNLKYEKLKEIYRCLKGYQVPSDIIDSINFNSSKQLSNLIYNILKCKKPERNEFPRGKAFDKLFTATMTNAKLLERINHSFVTLYLELASIQSTLTFIKTYTELAVNNRLYPSFNITGTITGRLSCSKPNLQNIKKKSVDKFTPRSLFVPERGETLVSIDYQQQEIRMLAVLSGDKHLLSLVNQGIDMHTAVGTKMLGKSELTKEERGIFKNLHFG